ncbi:MAG: rhodanese-related sulfurtransferase [Gammaproteobacteria bacterium]|nr:rhodanese-related sulfurtransferase [Gammaproteobacteria bacterium]
MKVAAFYHFLDLREPRDVQASLQSLCDEKGLLGTILVAEEGFNGTLAGDAAAIEAVLEWLHATLPLDTAIDVRWTDATEAPFRRMRVRLKPEIVTLGRPDLKPHVRTGRHVSPEEWNQLLENPEVMLIDTRNHYEVELGTFPQAIDPGTDSFREFANYAQSLPQADRERPVAMFCTGGIRCEKASALMLELGFDDVYHLQGGILNYLAEVPSDKNRWQGECFVFDSRVAVDRDLAEGGYVQCHACRRPLTSEDLASPDYREGQSCPHCIATPEPES